MATPLRQVRASFTDTTVRVYQAYSPAIAEPAVAAQRFVPPFKRGRMTWIKPSFTWRMYRCGWATKPDQDRVLGIDLTREGFEWALAHSSVNHAVGATTADHRAAPVRVRIEDGTPLARQVAAAKDRDPTAAAHLIPAEIPYPLPPEIAARIGSTG